MTLPDERVSDTRTDSSYRSSVVESLRSNGTGWQHVQLIGFVVLLFFAMRFAYDTYISDYAGLSLNNWWQPAPDTSSPMVWSLVLVVVTAAFVTRRMKTLSDHLVLLALVTPVLPMIVVFSDRAIAFQYIAASCAAVVAMSFIARSNASFRGIVPSLKHALPRVPRAWLRTAIIVIIVLTVALAVVSGGLSTFNLDLSRVYEFRRINVASNSAVLGYLTTNVMSLAVPLGMALALSRRQYALVTAFVMVSVVIGGLTSHKSHMFTPVMVLAIYYVLGRRRPAMTILWTGIVFAVLVGIWELIGRSSGRFGEFIIWRQFFVPAYTNLLHYDFFTEHNAPFFYWSQNKISLGLVSSDYPFPSSRVIGNFYYGRPLNYNGPDFSNANTGWIGSGFAELGYVGVAVYTCIVGLMLRIADQLSTSLGFRVAGTAVSISFLTVFTSADVITAFLSFGLLGILVLAAISRNPETASGGPEAVVSEQNLLQADSRGGSGVSDQDRYRQWPDSTPK